MSMNFNSKPIPAPDPKGNNNTKILGIIIAVVLGTAGAIGLIHEVQQTHNNLQSISTPLPTTNLEQKLFYKCQKLQDWYQSLDGFENTNYHCDKYAKAWSGLVK